MENYNIEIYIIFWIVVSLIIGAIGSSRKIGFEGAFFLSLLLSPLLGLIITLVSKSKDAIKYEQEVLATQKKQQETLEKIKYQNISSITDELKKIKDLLDSNVISAEEFETLKKKIILNFEPSENKQNTENKLENASKIYDGIIKEGSIVTPKYTETLVSTNSSLFGGVQKQFAIDFEDKISGCIFLSVYNKFKIEALEQDIYYSTKEQAIYGLYYILTTGKILREGRTYL
jgi:hypothetical protein